MKAVAQGSDNDAGKGGESSPADPAVGGRLSPEEAADVLFDDRRATIDFEAATDEEARRAVEEFARIFENLPGTVKDMIEGAKAGAQTLSGDTLQVLAEIIQNADDTGAAYVVFQVVHGHLIAIHDGRIVTLSDVLSLAAPWLTTKTHDDLATGRFGIGLMTHRAVSDVLDVHSGPYHIRLGDPSLAAITADDLVVDLPPGATAFSMPLRDATLDITAVSTWLDQWDDSALLFLRHVRRVTVLGADMTPETSVTLGWSDDDDAECVVGGHDLHVARRHAIARDGRAWLVHSVEAPSPQGVSRTNKASGPTVPLGLALPLQPQAGGVIYAGLPLVATNAPLLVNAQFDPVTGRSDLATSPWNRAMMPLLADLWVEVVEDLFIERPSLPWDVVPLPDDQEQTPSLMVHELEALLLARARTDLPTRVAIVVDGTPVSLTELAVEESVLEEVLSPEEVASLAGLGSTLPVSARDPAGRWRTVLDDWRVAGALLPEPVAVADALRLVEDPHRSPEATIALAAIGIEAGLRSPLAAMACVVTTDGTRVVPPTAESVEVLVVRASPLAEQLGIAVGLAAVHLAETPPAATVMSWLREIGAVIEDQRNEEVIRRLAAAGRAGVRLADPLDDNQLRAVRDAFEQMSPDERDRYGASVGRAVTIAAFSYDAQGRLIPTHARPAELYLSRAIDKEPDSFAIAAGKTSGLLWTDNRYAIRLRSELGRSAGLGAQKFLRLLGAEMAPRLVPHRAQYQRFTSDRRLGVDLNVIGSPTERRQAVTALGASYTLDDIDSPDLRAVALSIAHEQDGESRRERASALIGALGRAWDRLEESAEVTAAEDYYGWQTKGPVPAFWLWSAGSIKWLDDTDGVPQAPLTLRLRTASTIAVHGSDAAGYLGPEFDAPNRREVLLALGVSGEPSTRDLVGRLRDVRNAVPSPASVATDAASVYQALAERLTGRTSVPGDVTDIELRAAFDEGDGLVHTNLGWRRPRQVLAGPAVFRQRHAFVPSVRGTESLWTRLRIRHPSLKDCLDVIGQMARTRRPPDTEDTVVLLESLRLMATQFATSPSQPRQIRRRLSALALWTTNGWTTARPVYALDDPALAEGLRDEIPVWEPGGELSQFTLLLEPLRITALPPDAGTVVDPDEAIADPDATEAFAAAVSLLQDDLTRNDPQAAGALSTGWDRLREFEVRIAAELQLRVDGLVGGRSVQIEVAAKADVTNNALFLHDFDLLRQVAAGRAIASLFAATDRRRLAQAWLAAFLDAEAGRSAQRLVLAEQLATEERERTDRELAERVHRAEAMRQEIADRHHGRRRRRPGERATSTSTTPGEAESGPPATAPPTRLRTLVDPLMLVVNPDGTGDGRAGSSRSSRRQRQGSPPLAEPNRTGGAPQGRTPAAPFTSLDRETLGLKLAGMVLGGDTEALVDLRRQHNVGADAIDDLRRFYELKVYLGDEPDTIRLEESQIRRAMSTKDFFVVVVSNIEGVNARPKVRIIIDPLDELSMGESSSVVFTGVHEAPNSLVYTLERSSDVTERDGPDPAS